MASAPAPRPAQGFSTSRAQTWVLSAAIVTAMIYALRHLVEPSVSSAPAKGTKAQRLAGHGSPPAPLGTWLIAYGTGFMGLALLTVAAPELAGSLAILVVAGSLLSNGTSLVADIAGLDPTTEATGQATDATAAAQIAAVGDATKIADAVAKVAAIANVADIAQVGATPTGQVVAP